MSNEYCDPAEIRNAVMVAYEREGYLTENSRRDKDRMLEPILDELSARQVHNRDERKEKALTRIELVPIAFPNLLTLEKCEELPEEEKLLAKAVYRAIDEEIWGETTPSPKGRLQKLLAQEVNVKGLILCRTRVASTVREDAIYVTTDRSCIKDDLANKKQRQLSMHAEETYEIHAMIAERLPQHAKYFVSEFDKAFGNKHAELSNRGKLAIEKAKALLSDEKSEEDAA